MTEDLRERIADRLFGQIHGQGITSPLLLADAVLDVLGLEQVGWVSAARRLLYSEGDKARNPHMTLEPVYRLTALSDSSEEDSATRCRWCGCRLDTCRPLREHQRKCCPDCEHTAAEQCGFCISGLVPAKQGEPPTSEPCPYCNGTGKLSGSTEGVSDGR